MNDAVNKLGRMETMLVPARHQFPRGRVTACCGKQAEPGQAVLVCKQRSGDLTIRVVLHATCISETLDKMPLEKKVIRSRFDRMRAAIQRSGELFPEELSDATRTRGRI